MPDFKELLREFLDWRTHNAATVEPLLGKEIAADRHSRTPIIRVPTSRAPRWEDGTIKVTGQHNPLMNKILLFSDVDDLAKLSPTEANALNHEQWHSRLQSEEPRMLQAAQAAGAITAPALKQMGADLTKFWTYRPDQVPEEVAARVLAEPKPADDSFYRLNPPADFAKLQQSLLQQFARLREARKKTARRRLAPPLGQ